MPRRDLVIVGSSEDRVDTTRALLRLLRDDVDGLLVLELAHQENRSELVEAARKLREVVQRAIARGIEIEHLGPTMPAPKEVFVSYSRKDESWKARLLRHLEAAVIAGQIHIWSDEDLRVGADWQMQVLAELNRADGAILLVSPEFLRSEFIMGKEVPRLLERKAIAGIPIMPVLVEHSIWKNFQWLTGLQVHPRNGQPLCELDGNAVERSLVALVVEILDVVNDCG